MRKFGSKLRVPVCCLSEVPQLLADQIFQRALDAESVSHRPARLALLDPNPVEVHARYYIASRTKRQALRSK
jgi:hypothetical protein